MKLEIPSKGNFRGSCYWLVLNVRFKLKILALEILDVPMNLKWTAFSPKVRIIFRIFSIVWIQELHSRDQCWTSGILWHFRYGFGVLSVGRRITSKINQILRFFHLFIKIYFKLMWFRCHWRCHQQKMLPVTALDSTIASVSWTTLK